MQMLERIRQTAQAYWIFFVAVIAYNIAVPAPPAAPPARAKNKYPTHLKIVLICTENKENICFMYEI